MGQYCLSGFLPSLMSDCVTVEGVRAVAEGDTPGRGAQRGLPSPCQPGHGLEMLRPYPHSWWQCDSGDCSAGGPGWGADGLVPPFPVAEAEQPSTTWSGAISCTVTLAPSCTRQGCITGTSFTSASMTRWAWPGAAVLTLKELGVRPCGPKLPHGRPGTLPALSWLLQPSSE